jgi:hypothetical protein
MIRKSICLSVLLLASTSLLPAQECKLKFSVAYNDGKALQVGLTPEQKKLWDHDGAKKFKAMCLNAKEPNYIILWSDGLDGAELTKASINQFNILKTTGEYAATTIDLHGSLTAQTLYVRPTSMIRAKTDYLILDTSKTPYALIRQGQGYQDVPARTYRANQPGQKVNAEDIASTIGDPVAALENALKWLKKEKKL